MTSSTTAEVVRTRRAARRSRAGVSSWIVWPALVFLVLFFVLPVGRLLTLSATAADGSPTVANYINLFHTAMYTTVLWNTLLISLYTAVLCILIGYPVAYAIASVEKRAKRWLLLCVLIPFWTSFLVRTFAWIMLLGRDGFLNYMLKHLGATEAPIQLMYNMSGVLIGMVHALVPIAILAMLPVMEKIDLRLASAAQTLGASPAITFWRIYLPLSLPGVAAGALLVFITAIGFFIVPALLGSGRELMVAQIILQQVQGMLNWGMAAAVSVLLLVVTFVLYWLYDSVFGVSVISGDLRAEAGKPSPLRKLGYMSLALVGSVHDAIGRRLSAWLGANATPNAVFWIIIALEFVFLIAPAFIVIPISFTESDFIGWPPRGFSLRWYEEIADSPQWIAATWQSLVVATLSALLSLVLGGAAAYGLARAQVRWRTVIMVCLLAPLIVPRILTGVGLFYAYASIGLVGTTIGIVLGHTVLALPYVVVTLLAALKAYDARLDQAAWILGANKWKTIWHVTLPSIRGGVIAAFVFAFVTSFDDLTISIFVTGGIMNTLPKQMWDEAVLNVSPSLAAASTLMLLFILVLTLVGEVFRRRTPE